MAFLSLYSYIKLRSYPLIVANLSGVDLSKSQNLTQERIDSAVTDKNTKLPDSLKQKSQD
jgi:hypothetical protein